MEPHDLHEFIDVTAPPVRRKKVAAPRVNPKARRRGKAKSSKLARRRNR